MPALIVIVLLLAAFIAWYRPASPPPRRVFPPPAETTSTPPAVEPATPSPDVVADSMPPTAAMPTPEAAEPSLGATAPIAEPATPMPEEPPAPVPAERARRPVKLDPGTGVRVRLDQQLDTRLTREEQLFRATLTKQLKAGGRVVFDRGATVEGIVRRVDSPGRVHGKARMDLELRRIEGRKDWIDLTTGVLRREKSGRGKDTAQVGAGALIGGIVGGLVDGKRGAKRGAAAGVAAGAGTVMVTRGDDLVLAAGIELTFKLAQPLVVELAEEGEP